MKHKPVFFHYHLWTPYIEETEKFYTNIGFSVSQRIGKKDGIFQSFDPPLSWEDLRDQIILFRIIELKKGKVNITIGYGKKVIFDHIGFFVHQDDIEKICERANELNWNVDKGDRRTFLSTPYQVRIELQTNDDAIADLSSPYELKALHFVTKKQGFESDLAFLFQQKITTIQTKTGTELLLKKVIINDVITTEKDPNGVLLTN